MESPPIRHSWQKKKKGFDKVIRDILDIVDGPVSLEVISLDAEGMVREGRKLAKLGSNVVVKVPMTEEGLKATRIFANEGIRINQTLVFSPLQALMAAKAGAVYVSPLSEGWMILLMTVWKS